MHTMFKPDPTIWDKVVVLADDDDPQQLVPQQQQLAGVHQRARDIVVRGQGAGLSIQHAFDAPLFSGQQIIPGQAYDWAFMPLCEDPLYKRDGTLPIPNDILTQLGNIRRVGIDFDDIYIAHELPIGSVGPGRTVTADMLEPPVPKKVQHMSYEMGRTSRSMWKIAAIPLGIGAFVGAAALAAPLAIVSLDPVLFGVVVGPGRKPQPGELASFIYLAHWQYNKEE